MSAEPQEAAPAGDSPGAAAEARLTAYLDSVGLEWELGGRPGEHVVTLPGEKKLKTVVSVLVRDRTTSVSAFVIRNPDENHEAFYRTLLRRNLRLQGVAYAVDTDGDVYLRGEVPTVAVEPEHLDQLFGIVLSASDDVFNELLALGFLGSMRKEWAWRVSRGESTRNLDAFRHLLDDGSDA
ncbi:YbjN domain-containing protein [Terrabacter sp. Ter38]|uniref:YbjN domain-containing protein n=1 Tax=Terrabacter sp. Ter38 TaxID=2926030 RepID=UPI0021187E67|nr:YbjN domain-containing protein [Terrabacter sp. Ter38]